MQDNPTSAENIDLSGECAYAQQAEKRIKTASTAGFVSAAITLIFGVVALFQQSDHPGLGYLLDPEVILDAVLLAGLAFMVRKQSFVAAVILLSYWVIAKVLQVYVTGQISGLITGVFFAYWFFNGARGAWYFRQHQTRTRKQKMLAGLGWVTGGLFILMMSLGTVITIWQGSGNMPADSLVSQGEMPEHHLEVLRDAGIIMPNEQVILFYSAAIADILDDGNMVTDSRVISYFVEDGELQMEAARFVDIGSVFRVHQGSAIEDSLLQVNRLDESYFQLYAPVSNEGDIKFVSAIRSQLSKAAEAD